MARRKTRPFLLHEIMSSFHSSQENEDNSKSSSILINDSSQQTTHSGQSIVHHNPLFKANTLGESKAQRSVQVINSRTLIDTQNIVIVSPATTSTTSCNNPQDVFLDKANSKPLSNTIAPSRPEDELKAQNSSLPTMHPTRGPGYLANRRSAAFAISQDEYADGQSAVVGKDLPGIGLTTATLSTLKGKSSTIRLLTSIDGKARVTTGNESPPQAQPVVDPVTTPRVRAGLQRSQSAIESNNPSATFSRHSMTGRSRDARTWEFYCDNDSGSALTEQAKREQSGSAIGPIALIRSSSKKAKAQATNKRNANASKHEPMKRQKPDSLTGKPKFSRALSSVARLQSVTGNMQKERVKATDKDSKPRPKSDLYEYYSGDSDKENWEPGTRRRNVERVTNPQASGHRRRPVLEENGRIPSQSSSLDILMNHENVTPRASRPKAKAANAQKLTTPAVEDEVTAFMGGAGELREGSEDLDCVQSLLSLSQAAWP